MTTAFTALAMTMASIAQAKSAMTTVFTGPGKWATIAACMRRVKWATTNALTDLHSTL
jgi:hypothetical protein